MNDTALTGSSFIHSLFLCVILHWTFNFLHQSNQNSRAALSLLQSILQPTQLHGASVPLGGGGMAKNLAVLRFCVQNNLCVNSCTEIFALCLQVTRGQAPTFIFASTPERC